MRTNESEPMMAGLDGLFQRIVREAIEHQFRATLSATIRELHTELVREKGQRSTEEVEAPRMTANQVAELAGVAPKTVLRWARSGQLTAERAGRLVRFRRCHVEAFLQNGATRTEVVDVSRLADAIMQRSSVGKRTARRSK